MFSTTTKKYARHVLAGFLLGALLCAQTPSSVQGQTSKSKKQRSDATSKSESTETTENGLPQNSRSYRSPGYQSPVTELPGNQVTGGQASAAAFSRNGQATAQASINLGGEQQTYGAGIRDGDSLYSQSQNSSNFMPLSQFPQVTSSSYATGDDGVAIERSKSIQNGKVFRKTIVKKDGKRVSIIENDEEGIQVAIRDTKSSGEEANKTYFAKSRQELEQSEPKVYEWVKQYGDHDKSPALPGFDSAVFSDGFPIEGGGRFGSANGNSATSGSMSRGMAMGRSSSSSSGAGPSLAHSSAMANQSGTRRVGNELSQPSSQSQRSGQSQQVNQDAQQSLITQLEQTLQETNDPTLKQMIKKMIDDLRR